MRLILPGDKTHPPRPNLPVLRHLTFTEIHAMELGLYFAVIVVVAIELGAEGAVVPLAVVVGRKLVSDRRAGGAKTDCDHGLGFHDARAEPQYFGATAVLVPLAYYAATSLAIDLVQLLVDLPVLPVHLLA